MNQEIIFNGCPVRLGNPLKVANSAWERWGIRYYSNTEFRFLIEKSEACYTAEWEGTDDRGLQDIAAAAELAGLADCNKKLNESVAEEVIKLADFLPENPIILDVGAGTSSTTFKVLEKLSNLKKHIQICLLEPNNKALEQGKKILLDSNFARQIDIHTYNHPDLKLVELFLNPTFDLVISSAALHHHAFLYPAVLNISNVLKQGGLLIVGDWHNSMWLDPGRVYNFLQSLDWKYKLTDLSKFSEIFQIEPLPETDPLLRKANEQICSFWKAYAEVKTPDIPAYEILEGHRPPIHYQEIFEKVGLNLIRPLRMLLDQSALLCVHIGQKQ